MQPGRFTELFFLDEVTAFAVGHRPCALCRREDYERFSDIWRELHPYQVGADAIDAHLHAERVDPTTRGQRRHETALDDVPDGAFVLLEEAPHVVLDRHLLVWSPAGYVGRVPRPMGWTTVTLTPPSLMAVLRAGWQGVVPFVHPTALGTHA